MEESSELRAEKNFNRLSSDVLAVLDSLLDYNASKRQRPQTTPPDAIPEDQEVLVPQQQLTTDAVRAVNARSGEGRTKKTTKMTRRRDAMSSASVVTSRSGQSRDSAKTSKTAASIMTDNSYAAEIFGLREVGGSFTACALLEDVCACLDTGECIAFDDVEDVKRRLKNALLTVDPSGIRCKQRKNRYWSAVQHNRDHRNLPLLVRSFQPNKDAVLTALQQFRIPALDSVVLKEGYKWTVKDLKAVFIRTYEEIMLRLSDEGADEVVRSLLRVL